MEATGEIARLEGRIKQLEAKSEEDATARLSSEKKAEEMNGEWEVLAKLNAELYVKVNKAEKEKSELAEEVKSLREMNDGLKKNILEKDEELARLREAKEQEEAGEVHFLHEINDGLKKDIPLDETKVQKEAIIPDDDTNRVDMKEQPETSSSSAASEEPAAGESIAAEVADSVAPAKDTAMNAASIAEVAAAVLAAASSSESLASPPSTIIGPSVPYEMSRIAPASPPPPSPSERPKIQSLMSIKLPLLPPQEPAYYLPMDGTWKRGGCDDVVEAKKAKYDEEW